MWSVWDGDDREAVTWLYQSHCRVIVLADGPHMYIDGRRVLDNTVVDMATAKRALERAAYRRSRGTARFSA